LIFVPTDFVVAQLAIRLTMNRAAMQVAMTRNHINLPPGAVRWAVFHDFFCSGEIRSDATMSENPELAQLLVNLNHRCMTAELFRPPSYLAKSGVWNLFRMCHRAYEVMTTNPAAGAGPRLASQARVAF
jgi:hypothetical protein